MNIKQMHAIVENMQDGVVTISNKGNNFRTFQAMDAECIFGYGRDEMNRSRRKCLINTPHRKYLNKYISKYTSQEHRKRYLPSSRVRSAE